MADFLYDSNVISEIMRPKADPKVSQWLNSQKNLCLSVISVHEILYGLHRKSMYQRIAWFEAFVSQQCDVIEIDTNISRRSAEMRSKLSQNGRTQSLADALIGATAWTQGLTLATRNTKDFEGTGMPLFNPFED